MATTRAGRGCGSCKGPVADIVTAALGADLETDPAESYHVPCIPMDKPALVAEIRRRGLRWPSAVFAALAEDGAEHAGSKITLASLLRMMWVEPAAQSCFSAGRRPMHHRRMGGAGLPGGGEIVL